MASYLFEPLALRSIRLSNRIVVAPMTQFSANDGVAGDWHPMHLGQYVVSGAAMVLTESTYVAANARNARSCLSLYSDEQEEAVGRIAGFFDAYGDAVFGVTLTSRPARPGEAGASPAPETDGIMPVTIVASDLAREPRPFAAPRFPDTFLEFWRDEPFPGSPFRPEGLELPDFAA